LNSKNYTGRLVIIGGGISAAQAARQAREWGFTEVVLLERRDYAGETSQGSTKLAHGGYRYLLYFDFLQVLRALAERHHLFAEAPNCVFPIPMLYPVVVEPNESRFMKLLRIGRDKLGLGLYDAFQNNREFRSRFIPREGLDRLNPRSPVFNANTPGIAGCFRLWDGKFADDAAFVSLCILEARRKGVLCANYAEVERITPNTDRSVTVHWKDVLTGKTSSLQADGVLNCAGPWAPEFISEGHRSGTNSRQTTNYSDRVAYSRGVHLIFPNRVEGDNLFVPMYGKKNRLYFVINVPGEDACLVGTTELSREIPERNPTPLRGEIEEIMGYVKREPALSRLGAPISAIAGVRTLRLKTPRSSDPNGAKKEISTAQLSRDHEWLASRHMNCQSLIGGKFTDARSTAAEGLRRLRHTIDGAAMSAPTRFIFDLGNRLAHKAESAQILASGFLQAIIGQFDYSRNGKTNKKPKHIYPGCELDGVRLEEFRNRAKALAVPSDVTKRLLGTFGSDVFDVSDGMLAATKRFGTSPYSNLEVFLHLATRQVETLDDLMRRRLGIIYYPTAGLDFLNELVACLKAWRPEVHWDEQARQYREAHHKVVQTIADAMQSTNYGEFLTTNGTV